MGWGEGICGGLPSLPIFGTIERGRKMRIRHGISKEERIAVKIGTLLLDLSLDLEAIAFYLYRSSSYMVFRRIIEVLESAIDQANQAENVKLEINRDWNK